MRNFLLLAIVFVVGNCQIILFNELNTNCPSKSNGHEKCEFLELKLQKCNEENYTTDGVYIVGVKTYSKSFKGPIISLLGNLSGINIHHEEFPTNYITIGHNTHGSNIYDVHFQGGRFSTPNNIPGRWKYDHSRIICASIKEITFYKYP